jgi:Domain of unknown function (DUF4878)
MSLFIFLFTSCGSNSDPKDVAIKFLNAQNKMDYETAKKYGTDATDISLDWLAREAKTVPKEVMELTKNATVEVISEPFITGNTASLKVNNIIGGVKKESIIMLQKEADGKWYVNDDLFNYNETIPSGSLEDSLTSDPTVEVGIPNQPTPKPAH